MFLLCHKLDIMTVISFICSNLVSLLSRGLIYSLTNRCKYILNANQKTPFNNMKVITVIILYE